MLGTCDTWSSTVAGASEFFDICVCVVLCEVKSRSYRLCKTCLWLELIVDGIGGSSRYDISKVPDIYDSAKWAFVLSILLGLIQVIVKLRPFQYFEKFLLALIGSMSALCHDIYSIFPVNTLKSSGISWSYSSFFAENLCQSSCSDMIFFIMLIYNFRDLTNSIEWRRYCGFPKFISHP